MIHTADTRAARRENVSISQTIVDTLLGGSGLRGVQNRQLDAQRLHVADELLHARPIECDRASASAPKGGSRRRISRVVLWFGKIMILTYAGWLLQCAALSGDLLFNKNKLRAGPQSLFHSQAEAGPQQARRNFRLWGRLETISMNIRGYLLALDDLGNGAPPHCDFR